MLEEEEQTQKLNVSAHLWKQQADEKTFVAPLGALQSIGLETSERRVRGHVREREIGIGERRRRNFRRQKRKRAEGREAQAHNLWKPSFTRRLSEEQLHEAVAIWV